MGHKAFVDGHPATGETFKASRCFANMRRFISECEVELCTDNTDFNFVEKMLQSIEGEIDKVRTYATELKEKENV